MKFSKFLESRLKTGRRQKNKGFTIIELGVVLAIIGLLVMEIYPHIKDINLDSKITDSKSEVVAIAKAVQKTYVQDPQYPATVTFADIEHQLPDNIDIKNPFGIDYVIKGGGITYGSGCSKTSRTADRTLFNIALTLPANSDKAVSRVKDDYDDCTAMVSGMTVTFEFE